MRCLSEEKLDKFLHAEARLSITIYSTMMVLGVLDLATIKYTPVAYLIATSLVP